MDEQFDVYLLSGDVASNLYTNKRYGDQQGIVETLRELFRTEIVIRLLLCGDNLDDEATELSRCMTIEIKNPPLHKWHPLLYLRKENLFIDFRQVPPKNARPTYEFKPKVSFSSLFRAFRQGNILAGPNDFDMIGFGFRCYSGRQVYRTCGSHAD
jgi:hypothetical protein